jgi:hypothetical protein
MNRFSPANTLKHEKQKVLLLLFGGTPYTGAQLNRSDKMHR